MNNIRLIVNKDFCVGCSCCELTCPHKAIKSMYSDGIFKPVVDVENCSNCGLCLKVCPSYQVDVVEVYPKLDMDNIEYPSYVIWSRDSYLRSLGTSGGVVSTMIIALLESKKYDKAYVLDYENFTGTKAILYPVSNRDEVIKAVKSKYIPASVEQIIYDIKTDNIGKSIIVATPCQLLSIKRYLKLRNKSEENLLFFGLFCDKTEKYEIYNFFEKKYGSYQILHFRDKIISGWPGNVLIKQNGKIIDIPREERMAIKNKYQLNRCNYCFDKLNMLADISFGDCYMKEYASGKLGRSNIVIRTPKGKNVFESVKNNFETIRCSFNDIKHSQNIDLKKSNINLNNTVEQSIYVNIPQDYKLNKIVKQKMNKTIINKFYKILRIISRLIKGPKLPQIIFIDNVGFVNKGDQLMIESVVKQIKKNRPNAQIVLTKDAFYQDINFCLKNSIYPIDTPLKGLKGLRYRIAIKLLINKPQLMITHDMIDVVLDCRGFHLGDHWINDSMPICYKPYPEFLLNYYKKFSNPNCKIILLPQAFGPFNNDDSKKCIRLVNEKVTRIYAREQSSYEYLKQVLSNTDNIKVSPDFTCLHLPDKPAQIQLPLNSILLIPNARMIDKTDSETSTNYIKFLSNIIEYIISLGENVYLLNHEGISDELLMHELNTKLSKQLPIITRLSGIDIKELISRSKLLITGRFHGAVSGLSQGVPTLCTSWSHKYQELLKEYKCEDNILKVLDIDGSKKKILDALKNPKKYSSKEDCIKRVESNVTEMWEDIFKLI